MDAATERNYANPFAKRFRVTSSNDLFNKGRKRVKVDEGIGYNDSAFSSSWRFDSDGKRNKVCSKVVDYSDPFSINNVLKELEAGKFGSVTNDIRELLVRRRNLLDSCYATDASLSYRCFDAQNKVAPKAIVTATPNVIDLDEDNDESNSAVQRFVPVAQPPHLAGPVVIIDLDDDNDVRREKFTCPYVEVNLKKPSGNLLLKDFVEQNFAQRQISGLGDAYVTGETDFIKDKGVYVGTDDDGQLDESGEHSDTNSDGLGDIWNEMTVALECSKVICWLIGYSGRESGRIRS